MQRPSRRPDPTTWINLAVGAIFVFYAAQITLDLVWGTVCGHVAVDYCDTWSTAEIANTFGYAHIYDVQLIGRIEKSIFPPSADPALFVVTPSPYLAIFVPPFQPFALLPPTAGYVLWTLANLCAAIAYLRFLGNRLNAKPPGTRLLVLIFASLPVFFDVFYGNAAVWLMICAGEVTRALHSGHRYRAGLWLGGLLLKPPLLILPGLVLLVQRAGKSLAGLATSSVVIVGLSYVLVGSSGFKQMAAIWGRSVAGQPSDGVESMMNWRMLGANLSAFLPSGAAWGLAATGMVATLLVAILVWRRPLDPTSDTLPIALSGIFAASTLFAWHSHVHSALLVLPPMLLLYERRIAPRILLDAWFVAPALIFVAILVPESLIRLGLLGSNAMHLVYLMRGGGEFLACLALFVWAARRTSHAP